jgi:hypothetical protein
MVQTIIGTGIHGVDTVPVYTGDFNSDCGISLIN